VSWAPPDVGFHCIAGYLVTWKSSIAPNADGQIELGADVESVDITGLPPCTAFTVTVRTIDATEALGLPAVIYASTKDVGELIHGHLRKIFLCLLLLTSGIWGV